ncbi:MAG: polya polymerase, partial [Deltaproteobacteria bacterium]
LLFAFLLIPWATIHFDIIERKLQGPQLYQLAKQIREALNETIGQSLNLRRSTRQEITTLLAHLPLLIQTRVQKNWPKWLKRKSYFQKCKLLYLYYLEAIEQEMVPDAHFSGSPTVEHTVEKGRNRSKNSKRKGRPAFSANRRGGVFGFKR